MQERNWDGPLLRFDDERSAAHFDHADSGTRRYRLAIDRQGAPCLAIQLDPTFR